MNLANKIWVGTAITAAAGFVAGPSLVSAAYSAPKNAPFAASVAPNPITVNCAPGATTGAVTEAVRVAVRQPTSKSQPGNTGNFDHVLVTWQGGGGQSVTLNAANGFFRRIPAGSSFPCSGHFSVKFQPKTSSGANTGRAKYKGLNANPGHPSP